MDDQTNAPLASFALVVPLEKFVYRHAGQWQVDSPVGPKTMKDVLRDWNVDPDTIDTMFKKSAYLKVFSIDNTPNTDPLFRDQFGYLRLNTWVKPRLTPAQGHYPRISTIIDWLVGHDPEGATWLLNWIAFKVQNPAAMPLTAVLLCGQPGSGKNTLSRVIREILGMENTADLNREALESRFNSRWISGLFAYGDDCFTNENAATLNEKLKVLIASSKIELEGKGTNQREVQNRLSWLLSSNKVAPLVVEKEDRRYTIFNNFDLISTEYKSLVKSCFDVTQKERLDPTFEAEIRGFWHDLIGVQVDRALVSNPYDNEARNGIIASGKEAHESFFEDVDSNGIDWYINDLTLTGDPGVTDRDRWDFGEDGVSTDVIYKAYRVYCDNTGKKPLALNKFGGSIQKHRPVWPGPHQHRVPGTTTRVNGYQVKRSPEAIATYRSGQQGRERKESAKTKRELSIVPNPVPTTNAA